MSAGTRAFRMVSAFLPRALVCGLLIESAGRPFAAVITPATPPASTIAINECSLTPGRRLRLRLHFTNTGSAVAHRVDFAVRYGDLQRIVTDAGTFSPGVEIDHAFSHVFKNTGEQATVSCSVRSVDGISLASPASAAMVAVTAVPATPITPGVGIPATSSPVNAAGLQAIAVNDCRVVAGRNMWLGIRFTNTSAAVANAVDFAVQYGGRERTIQDRGTFSPGVGIAHAFLHAFPDTGRQEAFSCRVTRVQYAQAPAATSADRS